VLTGLANVLNDYHQDEIHKTDYLHLLKQYAEEHYLNGKPDLQEDYDAETGKPIVGLDRSHHYNHSGYVDLIVTGLCGIRPQEGDALVVNPLVEAKEMPYFCLQDLPYHGHSVTVLWDFDGTHYHAGKGLQVFVDGRRRAGSGRLQKLSLSVGKPIVPHSAKPADSALNVVKRGFPEPSASVNPASVWQAVDGRVWFFSEIPHGWSTLGSENSEDWFQVDFGTEKSVRRVRLQFFEGGEFLPPEKANVQAWQGEAWKEVASVRCVGNGPAEVSFPPVKTSKLRILIGHAKPARLVQLSAFSAP